MTLIELFVAELEREAPRTRRALEQVPLGRDDWKPHPKSMPLGRLAGLVASMPSWVSLIIGQDELHPDYIIPSVFDRRVGEAVADRVEEAAYESGVARRERATVDSEF